MSALRTLSGLHAGGLRTKQRERARSPVINLSGNAVALMAGGATSASQLAAQLKFSVARVSAILLFEVSKCEGL